MKLKLDLHPIYNDSQKIEAALLSSLQEALQNRITELEIIPGKGSGQLKKAVLRFLDRPEIKSQYHRIEKDGDNWGRLFVHFRWERLQEGKAAPAPTRDGRLHLFRVRSPSHPLRQQRCLARRGTRNTDRRVSLRAAHRTKSS